MTLESQPGFIPCPDTNVYVPTVATSLPQVIPVHLAADGDDAWVSEQHASDVGNTQFEFVVQVGSGPPVVVEQLHVVVLSSQPAPRKGTEVEFSSDFQLRGDVVPIYATVDLDSSKPTVDLAASPQAPAGPPPRLPYQIDSSTPLVIDLAGTTASHEVTWEVKLEYSSEGRTGTIVLNDYGQPLRTTAATGLTMVTYSPGKCGWQKSGSASPKKC